MLSDHELERLRAAAEDAAWLCARGYAPGAVATFIANERSLSPREQALLDASARADANHRHHIARELDAEDLERRPLRVDVESVVRTVAALLASTQDPTLVLLASQAGLVTAGEISDAIDAATENTALDRTAAAILSVKPSAVRLVHTPAQAQVASALARRLEGKRKKLTVNLDPVDDVAARLHGAVFVISSTPTVLDRAGTWWNLVGAVAEDLGAPLLRLG